MWASSHSCLTRNNFDCTDTSKSHLPFPSHLWLQPELPQPAVTNRFGSGALTRSGHLRLKTGISRERVPAPEGAPLVLPGAPSHPAALGASGVFRQRCFHSWVDSIRLLDKKWPDFSELLSVLRSQQSLRVLHFEHFIFPPANYLLLSTAPALPLLVQYISPKYFCIFSTIVFWSFLKSTERQLAMGRRNGYTTIFFCLYRCEEPGSENPGAGSQ